MGGHLAEILDRSAQDFISDEVKTVYGDTNKQWWIGGHVNGPEEPRSWFWIDNTRISTTQWAIDEPNDFEQKEDCVELSNSTDLKWNDENCGSARRYVCQFGLPSCGDPGEPLHGSRTPSDTSTFLDGATIEYQCDLGYEVKGSTSATCMLNGRWDTERPVCEGENQFWSIKFYMYL
ncbi:C-type lectin lectoxin-Phi1-like [Strongylocentrotus purpuratus]|uniref:Uncharacterized protein n=1 Tax=Strongylocentrotus purpuratus TaxID=7668 RepID=A0A7M7HEW6_STRPU|nr:C-type lectin lectoxin-Phi1-like [Strongylocentrotus purpuratus]|eukprot:XP_011660810.1 PREDICTED: C-type lectin lectoxin-Phi1-like [Strongylocentrotus purpuratus]